MSGFHDLLSELKRRRVFRVAGAYLVGAWIVLQVSDTLLPALRLPPWTVTLVAVAIVLGFPLALLLGWAFDITPGGVERVTSSHHALRFPARAAVIGSLLVALGVAGFVGVRRRATAARLDMNAVAVLPFRVIGDANLAVMREGIVDLMAAKLNGEGGARAIDSRTTLAAWRRKVDAEDEDLPPIQAMQLARNLGAGQVLLGEMVGATGKVSLNATLYSSVSGATIESVEDTASADNVLRLVDRVVARLLTEQAGQSHRIEALLSESLTAVKAYLEGQRLHRRGDYNKAAARFKAALDQDSTFALAAIGLFLARSWSGYGPEFTSGLEKAWKYRDRLPQRDHEYLIARLGANYPAPTPREQRIRGWEKLVARSPDRVEAWYELGDNLFHAGAQVGIDNAHDRALEAWSHALALDSLFAPALDHQIDVYASRGDTASVRRVADILFTRVKPQARLASNNAWVAAHALGDEVWLAELRKHVKDLPASDAMFAASNIVKHGLPQTDIALLYEASIANATQPHLTIGGTFTYASLLFNMGRPAAAMETLQKVKQWIPPEIHAFSVVVLAMQYDMPDNEETRAAMTTVSRVSSEKARAPELPGEGPRAEDFLCAAERWRVLHGNTASAEKALDQLRNAIEADPQGTIQTIAPCAASLEALLKLNARSPDARLALQRVDSLLLHNSVPGGLRDHLALFNARGYQQVRDLESGYRATRRVSDLVSAPLTLERARLAAATKRRDEAIRAYQLFLRMQQNPEPGPPAELVAHVRSELAALVAERN